MGDGSSALIARAASVWRARKASSASRSRASSCASSATANSAALAAPAAPIAKVATGTPSRHLQGVDSLHSIVQMPRGVPVATFAIGAAGAANAALFAVALLAHEDARLREALDAFRARQTEAARAMSAELPSPPANP